MSDRHQLIAGNWKMNKTGTEARELVRELLQTWEKPDKVDVVICPPFTALEGCKEEIGHSAEIYLGAQNMHEEAEGAFTGEISASMLQDLWCKFVILGHSERRQYFKESDALVNKKARTALAGSLKPIICVGETLEEREAGKMETVVVAQVQGSCQAISTEQWKDVVIAYEPVWAIGTGKTASPEQAQEVHHLIRHTVEKMTDAKVAQKLRILYGGSVKPDNAAELLSQPDIDGALVGGASLKADSFNGIIKNACQASGAE